MDIPEEFDITSRCVGSAQSVADYLNGLANVSLAVCAAGVVLCGNDCFTVLNGWAQLDAPDDADEAQMEAAVERHRARNHPEVERKRYFHVGWGAPTYTAAMIAADFPEAREDCPGFDPDDPDPYETDEADDPNVSAASIINQIANRD